MNWNHFVGYGLIATFVVALFSAAFINNIQLYNSLDTLQSFGFAIFGVSAIVLLFQKK